MNEMNPLAQDPANSETTTCPDCGGPFPADFGAGENECRCICEKTAEYRKHCDCAQCERWRGWWKMGGVS